MKSAPEHPWPPLITNVKVPWFIIVRDWLLTLLAWFFLVYLMRLGLLLIWDYFSSPIFELSWMKKPDWGLVWERLAPFVYMILVVVTWIFVWGVKRRAQLRRTSDPRRLSLPLPLEEHAASLGLDPQEIERWRDSRIVTVHFEADRISIIQAGRSGGPPNEKLA